ncbi:hypothetical protein FQN49_004544 [Arthroderma sp. PD_2]|nr:hypothetical protein FQN49_004544 [Arthroderma sp. PD_2]
MTPIDTSWKLGYTGILTPKTELKIVDIEPGESIGHGDKGFVDLENGQLILHARYHELNKIGKEAVLPVNVDEILMISPSVKKAANTSVVAWDDKLDLEIIFCAIVKEGSTITAQEVVEYAASRSRKQLCSNRWCDI